MKNKVDPRVRRTHIMLRDALISLIAEKGYHAITVQDIAERSTLNRATFYLHYRDKQDLLDKSVNVLLEEFKSAVKTPLYSKEKSGFSVSYLHQLLRLVYEHIGKNASIYKVLLLDNEVPGFFARLVNMLEDNISIEIPSNQFYNTNPKIPKEIIIQYIVTSSLGVIKWWLKNDMPYSSIQMAEFLESLSSTGPFNAIEFRNHI